MGRKTRMCKRKQLFTQRIKIILKIQTTESVILTAWKRSELEDHPESAMC